ncbi:MAG: iron-containing alcohol dehydrogenase [Clostridia bacterium]|nr:iron-containing alcohol dehydrogenase [Clostridia bacterium]
MLLDCAAYAGTCECGREHPLVTKKVVVEYGAIKDFDKYMEDCGLSGRRTVIYDSNTYNLPGLPHVPATKEIVLPADGLHSEKTLIEAIIPELDDPDVLVAVGGGTIMDFARYNAFKLGLPFAAIPTLVSSDGFTANICSVVIDGQKKSLPMEAPVLVVADLDIISGAPMFLAISGIADILSKYISLADWKIAHLVSGEYYCPRVAGMAEEALGLMARCAEEIRKGEKPDFESMTMAQMISGLTMQMMGNSRAASGAEHLIAHLVEMKPPRFENAHGIHGECVGVGTILCAEAYHKLAEQTPTSKSFVPLDPGWVREKFGPLADGVFKENENDVLATFDPKNIVDNWAKVVDIIHMIPSAEALNALFADLGAKRTLADIGIDPALKPEVLDISAAIRNRLTLARMRRLLDFEDVL